MITFITLPIFGGGDMSVRPEAVHAVIQFEAEDRCLVQLPSYSITVAASRQRVVDIINSSNPPTSGTKEQH